MELLEKLLTLYWPQTTLILLAIGYLIKRVLDNKSKKIEINYAIFQQKRLEAMQKFITAFSNSEQAWRLINLDEVASKSITADKLGDIVEPVLREMKSSVLELQIYLDNADYALFEEVLANTNNYYLALSRLYFNYDAEKTSYIKLQEFQEHSNRYLADNRKLIKQVNSIVKKTFR